jgi:DNA-binding MarR family transcriptional regulator
MNNNPRSVNPFTALPNSLFGRLEGYEWSLMMALRFHGCECYPSQKRLAELAGISISTAKRTLESLREKRIISWITREDERGQTTNIYTLHIDELWAPTPSPVRATPLGHTELPPRSVRATPQVCESYEQDLSKQDLLEQEKPPIIPQSEEKSKPVVKVPKALIPIKNTLADFVKNHKAGERSEQSCKILFNQLQRILEDDAVNGDIDAIRQILDLAIDSSLKGKPWQSIKYDNWVMYNRSKWIQYKNQRDLSNVKESQRTTLQIPDYHNRS